MIDQPDWRGYYELRAKFLSGQDLTRDEVQDVLIVAMRAGWEISRLEAELEDASEAAQENRIEAKLDALLISLGIANPCE